MKFEEKVKIPTTIYEQTTDFEFTDVELLVSLSILSINPLPDIPDVYIHVYHGRLNECIELYEGGYDLTMELDERLASYYVGDDIYDALKEFKSRIGIANKNNVYITSRKDIPENLLKL